MNNGSLDTVMYYAVGMSMIMYLIQYLEIGMHNTSNALSVNKYLLYENMVEIPSAWGHFKIMCNTYF